MKRRLILLLKAAVSIAIGFLIAYVLLLRPWHHRWVATDAEVRATLPGDSLVAATSQITHGITVNACPEKIWPWLMQIGQDRSGFYSYTPLENLFGCEMPKVEALKPEWKPRAEGETVWFCAPEHFKGQGYMVAAVVEPHKAFVMVSGPDRAMLRSGGRAAGGSWGFVLQAIDPNHTRLLGGAFWDPAQFFMERRMLKTIKHLAETTS